MAYKLRNETCDSSRACADKMSLTSPESLSFSSCLQYAAQDKYPAHPNTCTSYLVCVLEDSSELCLNVKVGLGTAAALGGFIADTYAAILDYRLGAALQLQDELHP